MSGSWGRGRKCEAQLHNLPGSRVPVAGGFKCRPQFDREVYVNEQESDIWWHCCERGSKSGDFAIADEASAKLQQAGDVANALKLKRSLEKKVSLIAAKAKKDAAKQAREHEIVEEPGMHCVMMRNLKTRAWERWAWCEKGGLRPSRNCPVCGCGWADFFKRRGATCRRRLPWTPIRLFTTGFGVETCEARWGCIGRGGNMCGPGSTGLADESFPESLPGLVLVMPTQVHFKAGLVSLCTSACPIFAWCLPFLHRVRS